MIVAPQPSHEQAVREAWNRHPYAPRVKRYDGAAKNREDMLGRLRTADTVVHFFDDGPLATDVLVAARPRRVVIAGPSGSVVDTTAVTAAGVEVYDTPGLAADSVAEFTIALLLAAARGLPAYAVRGEWQPRFGRDVRGARLGLIGLGRIGGRVAQLAGALGMKVSAWSPSLDRERAAATGVAPMALDDLLAHSDFVSLHLREAPATEALLDARRLRLLRTDAVLVNTARASLVDMAALRDEVARGRFAAIALDVLDREPLPREDPLWQHSRVLITPHMAWMTSGTATRFLDAALRFAVDGDPALVRHVRPERGEK